jgi:hypothetical protein
MDIQFKKITHYFVNPYVWAWLVITSTVLYVFISVVIDFQDWMIWLYATLIFPLLIGLWKILIEESQRKETYPLDLLDLQFAGLGSALTIFLSHELGIYPVIASSAVGIVGYLIIKKYAIAIYCGSFAGMISSELLLTYEVLLIALICGLVVLLLKPVFRGVGGKLGTMAFISTFLFAIVTQKDFLIANNDLNFLRLVIISLLGTLISFYTQHLFKQSSIIASALPSLVFALVMIYLIKDYTACAVVFFSASFIGMSSKERLKNLYLVLLAGIIHALMFYVYFEHYNGLGGKLGLMALSSVLITIGFYHLFLFFKTRLYKETV